MEKKTVLATATVGRVHGVDGFLKIYSLSGEIDHLLTLDEAKLVLKSKEEVFVTVKDIKMHQDELLMRFYNYETREKAKTLSGAVMYIAREKCPPLEEGEYYIADLYGMKIYYDGSEVAEVVDTSEGAQALLLHAKKKDGKIVLIPNMKPFVSRVSLDDGRIYLETGDVLS